MSRRSLDKALAKTFKKELEKADLTNAESSRKELDARTNVIHISKASIKTQMLPASHRNDDALASAILDKFLEYFKNKRLLLVTQTAVLRHLGLTGKGTSRTANKNMKLFAYHEKGSSDFVLIGPSFQTMNTHLKRANLYVANELKVRNLLTAYNSKNEVVKTYDIGHVGSGQHRTENTPALRYLDRVSKLFNQGEGSRRIKNVIDIASNSIEQAHKTSGSHLEKVGSWSSTFDKKSSMSFLSGKFVFVYTVPQSKQLNNRLSTAERNATGLINKFITSLEGSKSIDEQLDDILKAALWGNSTQYKSKTDTEGQLQPKKARKRAPRKAKVLKGKLAKLAAPKSQLDLNRLMQAINAALPAVVKTNMGRPHLINRTGRFADSVELTSITQGRKGLVSMFYSYMKYPYQTFEPGYAQGFRGYDPQPLISQSVREVATTLMTERFRVVGV